MKIVACENHDLGDGVRVGWWPAEGEDGMKVTAVLALCGELGSADVYTRGLSPDHCLSNFVKLFAATNKKIAGLRLGLWATDPEGAHIEIPKGERSR